MNPALAGCWGTLQRILAGHVTIAECRLTIANCKEPQQASQRKSLRRISRFSVGMPLLLHRYRARPGATMIVQGGEFVTARRCFPCTHVLRLGPGTECVAST